LSDERTEEATPKQIRKSRERGQVAKSTEMNAAAVLMAGLGVLAAQQAAIAAGLRAVMESAIATAVRPDLSAGMALGALGSLTIQGLMLIAPAMLAMVCAGAMTSYLQVGAIFTFETLKPKLDKLNVFMGLKNMLMSSKTWIEMGKATLKITVIAAMTWNIIQSELRTILLMGTLPVGEAAVQMMRITGRCVTNILLFYVGVAVLDFFYQRWQHLKGLRMSKEQVKQEYKEQEGDPHYKHKRKRMHEEISKGQMIRQVEKADIIVTNPTHIACALRYDPKQESAPRLIAKGEGFIAEQIKEIGKQQDIPIVRDMSLARALNELELDTQVPEELYDAAAELLKWVEMVAASQGQTPRWLKKDEAAVV
jgi:flagellar biosynthetic protein FlhB